MDRKDHPNSRRDRPKIPYTAIRVVKASLQLAKRRFRLSPRAKSMTVETAEIQLTPSAEANTIEAQQEGLPDAAKRYRVKEKTQQRTGG